MFVVGRRQSCSRAACFRIVGALALTHRIEREYDVSESRQALTAFLICHAGLPVQGVAHLKQNRRIGRLPGARQIQVGRNVQAGHAFVDDPLDSIALTFKAADRAEIQWTSAWVTASEPPERVPNPSLTLVDCPGRGELN